MKYNYSKLTIRRTILRYVALFTGLFVIANGIVFLINANLGVNPWDVLHIGLANQFGITIGRVTQIIGLLLIVISYFFKVRPNIGTILNMIFLGLFIDLVIGWGYVPLPQPLPDKIIFFIIGIVLFGFGVAFYISPNLGAGPRDSLMLALTRASKLRVGLIRTIMEVVVATAGYFLGGPLGIGTVIFALTLGIFMEAGFAFVRRIQKTSLYNRIWNIA
jgi:uncharacterized membrane protein YczE